METRYVDTEALFPEVFDKVTGLSFRSQLHADDCLARKAGTFHCDKMCAMKRIFKEGVIAGIHIALDQGAE